ncbi:MAG TPA: hypothetical protein VMW69_05095, partial [Spirochaetia bacterium]|nr:hypothetical protein [Spirochaetia bacterium]
MKRGLLVIFIVFVISTGAGAQTTGPQGVETQGRSAVSLLLRPTLDLPLGESAQLFGAGGSVDAGILYALKGLPLSLLGGVAYTFLPVKSNESLSIAAGQIGALYRLPIGSTFTIEAYAAGGYYYGTFNDLSVGSANPYASAGARLGFRLSPAWNIGLGALYRSYFGLYQGIGITAGATLSLEKASPRAPRIAPAAKPSIEPLSTASSPGSSGVSFGSANLPPIFPVFYKHYDDHPIGTIDVTNTASKPASDVAVSVYIKQYMDNPKESRLSEAIAAGKTSAVDLYALFTDSVLSITEGTKVSAEITLTYTLDGARHQEKSVQTVRFLNRNAMTWDDNRRPAAFITAMDPAVLTFSKSVTGLIRSREVRSINKSLQTAIALHEALDLYGVNYVTDPTTPFAQLSQQKSEVDFLQFPRQTLQYRAGDCD